MDDLAVHDWSAPYWDGWREQALQLAAHADWRAAATQMVAAAGIVHNERLMRFMPQTEIIGGQSYEEYIARRGAIPSRDNLHDFFNALVWLRYSPIKKVVNRLQMQQIDAAAVSPENSQRQGPRGPLRDRLTRFDESGAVVVYQDDTAGRALMQALLAHDWQRFFVDAASGFHASLAIHLFGHSTLEKMVRPGPYKSMTVHALLVPWPTTEAWPDAASRAGDAAMAQVVADCLLREPGWLSRMTPLPLAGVPGWWPAQDVHFYQDAAVFRPARAVAVQMG